MPRFARKRDIQTQADLATLAAAAHLPHNAANDPAIYDAATKYAIKNEVGGQDTALWDFTDADTSNGFIQFDGKNKLRLFAPKSHVNFVLAPAAGLPDGMDVSAVAAAEIRSPGKGLPFYVSTTCGWGQQTILDQTSGPSLPPGPPPALTPTTAQAANVEIDTIDPTSVDVNPGAVSMTITATSNNGMNNVNRVGFTREGGLGHEFVDVNGSGDTLIVSVPAAVLSTEAVWWVRLRQGNQNRWSDSSNAKPFVVGDPLGPAPTSCDSKNSGNFGSLDLSRDDVNQPSRYLVENLAQGVQHDFDTYPGTPVTPCAGQPDAVVDSGTPVDGEQLNCLTTDTGSDLAQKATDAFITGTGSPLNSPPRLVKPTTTGCSPTGGSEEREMGDISGDPEINDDVLSCFLPAGVSVGAVTQATLDPSLKFSISKDIFDSPRFFWIPVLVADPSKGGSGSFAIVDFRAVFITDQPDGATSDSPMADPNNGVEMSSNGKQIEKIRVRAINPAALPEFSVDLGDGNTVDYLGSGTKIVRLVE